MRMKQYRPLGSSYGQVSEPYRFTDHIKGVNAVAAGCRISNKGED
jgi:hypothetical protein